MTQFKAPPLPQAPKPSFSPSPASPGTPENYPFGNEAVHTPDLQNSPDPFEGTIVHKVPLKWLETKKVVFILSGLFLIGLIFGMFFFSSSPAPQPTGMPGVVANPDIKERLHRCGQVDKGTACVLYLVNHTRYDKLAEEFFAEAVKLMEVQRYSVAMVNPKYAKMRIPPGYFAQIKIPNIR